MLAALSGTWRDDFGDIFSRALIYKPLHSKRGITLFRLSWNRRARDIVSPFPPSRFVSFDLKTEMGRIYAGLSATLIEYGGDVLR